MKKFITLFFIFLALPTFAVDTLKWSDIAPAKYQGTLTYEELQKPDEDTTKGLASYFAITETINSVDSEENRRIKENNYWYKRKAAFEKASALCKAKPTLSEQSECFAILKQSEMSKNSVRRQIKATDSSLNQEKMYYSIQNGMLNNMLNNGANNQFYRDNYYRR